MTPSRAQFVKALLGTALAALSWGTWSLFLRPCGIPASLTAPFVLVVMGLVLLPASRFDGVRPQWDRRSFGLLAALAACGALNTGTFFAAMSVTTLGVAVLSHYLAPLLVALAAPWVDGERVPGARWAALVATAGLTLVLEPWHAGAEGRWLGAALGAVSAFGYAANVFLAARLVPRIGTLRTVGLHAPIAAAILLPFVPLAAWATVTPRGLALVVVAGVLLGAVAGWLFTRGLPVIGPTLSSTLAFLEPLGAVVVGWLAWNEQLSGWAIVGAGLIVGAGAWVTRARAVGGEARVRETSRA